MTKGGIQTETTDAGLDLWACGFCLAGVDLTRADYSGKTLGHQLPTGSDRIRQVDESQMIPGYPLVI